METITITLNDVEVSGYPGMTILQLAREAGVDIPTLCDDPHLVPTGACRLCLVEDERNGALLASCVTPIAPGMVINSRSPKVLERRKTILELMLASHPDTCPICDKGNRCQLRRRAAEMGIGLLEMQRIPQLAIIHEVNPFIERDFSRCILCAKCIRADQELVVEGALDYLHRGFVSRPTTFNDSPLEKSECTFCGTCVAMCPSGALMEKNREYTGSTSTVVDTVCPYCGCGCSLTLEVKDNRVVRARPGTQSPVNQGALCVRGYYGYDFIHSPDRLTTPLIKTNGQLQPATWEQALERVATELKRIKENYGADSLAILGSSKCTNEENYVLQRFARSVLGTNNIDNGSRLYSAPSRIGLEEVIGFPGTTNSLEALEKSKAIMVIGADPEVSAPVVAYAIKRAAKFKGARLLLVDLRKTKLALFAHLWLKPGVGTDIALLNAMAKVIVDSKLFDSQLITSLTENFPQWSKSLEKYTPEYAEKVTGIPSQEIELAARLFAEIKPSSIVFGNGITQSASGTEAVKAIANLAMLTGSVGKEGGIFALQRENNAQGACDMGSLPDFFPGYQSVENAQTRKEFERRWGNQLPASAGLTALEMMEKAREGKIKGMLIIGENPVASFPHPSQVKNALSSLEFLAVTDIFLTETAKLATVVLPAASFAEKEGTFTNFEGRVQQVKKAVEPLDNSLPDGEIVLRLADKMGAPLPYSSPQQVMDEIREMIPSYSRPACPDFEAKGLFQNGSGKFCLVEYTPPEVTREGYPFTLQCGSILFQFGSGSRSLRASRLKKFSPKAFVEIGREDARELGIEEGDMVKIISPAGEVTAAARVTDTLSPRMLFMPISFPESPVYELFDGVLGRQAKTPPLKSCAVRLERI